MPAGPFRSRPSARRCSGRSTTGAETRPRRRRTAIGRGRGLRGARHAAAAPRAGALSGNAACANALARPDYLALLRKSSIARRTSSRIWTSPSLALARIASSAARASGAADRGERLCRPRPVLRREVVDVPLDVDVHGRPHFPPVLLELLVARFGFPAHELELVQGSAFLEGPDQVGDDGLLVSGHPHQVSVLAIHRQPPGKFAGGSDGFFLAQASGAVCGKNGGRQKSRRGREQERDCQRACRGQASDQAHGGLLRDGRQSASSGGHSALVLNGGHLRPV